jgi:hypothetical protein
MVLAALRWAIKTIGGCRAGIATSVNGSEPDLLSSQTVEKERLRIGVECLDCWSGRSGQVLPAAHSIPNHVKPNGTSGRINNLAAGRAWMTRRKPGI